MSGSTWRKWRQIQICNSSTRNPAIPWQLQNSKVPDCCHIGASLLQHWKLSDIFGKVRKFTGNFITPLSRSKLVADEITWYKYDILYWTVLKNFEKSWLSNKIFKNLPKKCDQLDNIGYCCNKNWDFQIFSKKNLMNWSHVSAWTNSENKNNLQMNNCDH